MEENRFEEQDSPVSEPANESIKEASEQVEPAEENTEITEGAQPEAIEEQLPDQKEEYVYAPALKPEKMSANKSGEKKASAVIASLLVACAVLLICVVLLTVALFIAKKSPDEDPGNGGPISGADMLTVSDVAEICSDFTVAIQVRRTSSSGSITLGTGSGFFLTENGYIATNSHVVSETDSITVYTRNGKSYGAKIIADDPSHDIALIRITSENEKFAVATVADYKNVRVGDEVVAIGTPHSIEYAWTVSVGHVSHTDRQISVPSGNGIKMMQIDVPVNPGNSGGPLINMAGEVVGIVAAKLDQKYEGINFAIPVSEHMEFFDSAIENDMSKPQLGVVGFSVEADSYYYIEGSTSVRVFDDKDGKGYYMYDSYYGSKYYLSDEESANVYYVKESGFLITGITENSDANGKLNPFDIITEFDGKKLVLDDNNDPYDTVVDILATKKATDVVKVKYLRDGKEHEAQISLKEKD